MYNIESKKNRVALTRTKKVSGREIERFRNEPYDNKTIVNKYFNGNVKAYMDAIEKGGGALKAKYVMLQNFFAGMQYEAEQAASWDMKLYIDIEGTPWLEDKVQTFMEQNPNEVLVEWDRKNPPKCFEDLKILFEEKMNAPKINDNKNQMADYNRFVDLDMSDLEDMVKEESKKDKSKTEKKPKLKEESKFDLDFNLEDMVKEESKTENTTE